MTTQGAEQAQAFDSYITGLREQASPDALLRLRPGAPLLLRRGKGAGPNRLEVRTPEGERLGWLPAEDGLALEAPPQLCSAQVLALVPARLLPRVQIRIFMPASHLVA